MNNDTVKGLIVSIYRASKVSDCTNGGVTSPEKSRWGEALLVGEGVTGPFEESEHRPTLKLVKRYLHGPDMESYLHAQPIKGSGYSFGGNFIYSSDSRFPNDYPIPVHDRKE